VLEHQDKVTLAVVTAVVLLEVYTLLVAAVEQVLWAAQVQVVVVELAG
jgi:hypothetical protein